MNLRKLKCLPFDQWGIWNFMEGDLTPEEMFREFTEIPAIIGKPGRYYDRASKVCWTELPNGKAYKVNPEMFLYEMGMAHSRERPLTDHERKAIKTLIDYGNAPVTGALLDRLYKDECDRMLRSIKRNATKSRIEIIGR
jgi:hypothetical protein